VPWLDLQSELDAMFEELREPRKWRTGFWPKRDPELWNLWRRQQRALRRGGAPKQSWRLTPEQKHWACTNGLSARETARQLGVNEKAVRKFRARALARV
jgi:DNA-binding CsgD family transcriptional regulator